MPADYAGRAQIPRSVAGDEIQQEVGLPRRTGGYLRISSFNADYSA